jgi:hypothetical protein
MVRERPYHRSPDFDSFFGIGDYRYRSVSLGAISSWTGGLSLLLGGESWTAPRSTPPRLAADASSEHGLGI